MTVTRYATVLIVIGVLIQAGLHLWQMSRYDFPGVGAETSLQLVVGIGFVLTNAVVTAGVVLIAFERWLLPKLGRITDDERTAETSR